MARAEMAEKIYFHCHCGQKLNVSRSSLGKTFTCPSCHDPVTAEEEQVALPQESFSPPTPPPPPVRQRSEPTPVVAPVTGGSYLDSASQATNSVILDDNNDKGGEKEEKQSVLMCLITVLLIAVSLRGCANVEMDTPRRKPQPEDLIDDDLKERLIYDALINEGYSNEEAIYGVELTRD